MKSKVVQDPRAFRSADFVSETLNKEQRTIDLVWTTGATVRRSSWFSDPWNEELEVSESAVRLQRLNSGAPLLNLHSSWSLDDVIGVVEKAWLRDGKGFATVRFSGDEESEKIFQKVCAGILRNVSVGYNRHKMKDVSKEDDKIKTYRVVDWEPLEISFVPIGADPGAGVRGADQETFPVEIIDDSRSDGESITQRGETMGREANSVENKTEAAPNTDEIRKQAAEQAEAEERQRGLEIRAAAKQLKLDDAVAEDLIKRGVKIDEARRAMIEKKSELDAANETRSAHRVEAGAQDEIATRRSAMESAILHRFNPSKFELNEAGRQYRGMSLVRLAEEIVGSGARGMTKNELAVRALTTSDFPLVLANVVGKTLRSGYQTQQRTFQPFVRFGTLPDYKEVSRVQFGDAPNLEKVNEHGEYTVGSIGEAGEKIKLGKYGRIVMITEEAIVNDDLDAFTRIPQMMGAAAARLESKLVYGILLDNAALADTVALFHATHGNLASSGTKIEEAGLNAMRAAMRKQKTVDGLDTLDIEPAFLVVGPDKETEARKILSAQILPTKSGDVNVFANSMTLIVDSRITGNKWFGIASPSQVDTIEVAYLEGMAGPQISTKDGFESDGVAIKVKHVVGVKAIDFRGMYYNQGA